MIDNNPDILEQAGDFNLNVCQIVSYRMDGESNEPVTLDIIPIIQAIELTEDIFNNCIMGRITVIDGQDFRSVLPITGLEKLELSFNTPGMQGFNYIREEGFPFHIYKIDAMAPMEPRAQLYNIYFTSREMFYNNMVRVNQSFTGPTEEAVNTILRNFKYLNCKKKFYYEPTKNNEKYVIPNLRPFRSIHTLAETALSANYDNAGYLFYENANGYFFRSIESLLAISGTARPSIFAYNSQPANIKDDRGLNNVVEDLKNVIKYEFDRPVNTLNMLGEGMYGSKLLTIDSFNRTFNEQTYSYQREFGKSFHTEHIDGNKSSFKFTLPWSNFEDSNTILSDFSDAKFMVTSNTRKIHNNNEFVKGEDYLQKRLTQRLSLQNINVTLNVYGNTLLHAGDIITFNLPLYRPVGDTGSGQANPHFAGRYMIMSIKHIISPPDNKHEMIIKCMKDAVRTEYPIERDTNTLRYPDFIQKTESLLDAEGNFLEVNYVD